MIAFAALAFAAGCSGGVPGTDAGEVDGGADSGDGGGTTGLHFAWYPDPVPPGEVEDDLRIDDVRLELRQLRVVGDAAPDDPRTSRDDLRLEWKDGAPAPAPLRFDTAPLGMYCSRSARAMGSGRSCARA